MEEKGLFKTALGGFRKADVLDYIDSVTAEWDTERQQLTADAQKASAEAQAARQDADAARQAAAQAESARDQAEKKADAMAEQVAHLTARLEEQQSRIDEMQRQVEEAEEKARTATTEMMAAEERLAAREQEINDRDEKLAQLEQQQIQYESVLGKSGDLQEHVDGIVRPFMESAGNRATAALEDTRNVITAMLAQLGELASGLEEKKQVLEQEKAQSDDRLTAALSDWLGQAKSAAKDAADRATHFFR